MDSYHDRLVEQVPAIRRTVKRLADSYGLTDDITQECCVRILEKEGLWKGQQAEGWMGVISRNLALRLRGRAARMRSMEKPLESDTKAPEVSDADAEEKIRWVLSQFASLPEKQREVLKMRYFENLSTATMAERLQLSEGMVSTHHARALKTLKGRALRAGWVAGILAWFSTTTGKAAAAVAIVAAAGGAAAYFYETDPSTNLAAKSTELKGTVITAVEDCPMEKDKNILYCSSFQLAWNELKKLAGGKIRLDHPVDLAGRLDAAKTSKEDLPPGSFVAMAGFFKDGVVDRINAELDRTFHRGPDPALNAFKVEKDGALAYAFMAMELKFRHPFASGGHLVFEGKPVNSFGFQEATYGLNPEGLPVEDNTSRQDRRQAHVYGKTEGEDPSYVVTLQPSNPDEEILLAHIKPEVTLEKTIESALAIRKTSEGKGFEGENDVLAVPVLDFDLSHTYETLIGRTVDGMGPIGAAVQTIRFKLDEKGAVLKSRAMIRVLSIPTRCVFDKPFLILLRHKDAPRPYFALWVDNVEVLVGEKTAE